MKAKHTPGPWTIRDYQDHSGNGVEVAQADSRLYIVRDIMGNTIAQSDANTRLIAAAPELLEALRGALVAFEQAYSALPDDSPAQDHFMACYIEPARAAIARATGEV